MQKPQTSVEQKPNKLNSSYSRWGST